MSNVRRTNADIAEFFQVEGFSPEEQISFFYDFLAENRLENKFYTAINQEE